MSGNIRKNKRIYIIDNIIDLSDEHLKKVFEKLSDHLHNEYDDDTERQDMLSYIEKFIKCADDTNLFDIRDMIDSFLTYESDDDKKVRIALELTNKILIAIDLKEIDKLTDFIDVRRDLLLSDACRKVIEENKTYVFSNGFKKNGCLVQQNVRYKHFTIFKCILAQTEHKLISKNKTKMSDGIFTCYTIKKFD